MKLGYLELISNILVFFGVMFFLGLGIRNQFIGNELFFGSTLLGFVGGIGALAVGVYMRLKINQRKKHNSQ